MSSLKFLPLTLFLAVMAVPQSGCASSTTKTVAAAKSAQPDNQLDELNAKIDTLKKWKEGYELTAERANFKADRLQFRNDDLIDARRLWKVAQNAEQKAKELQILIDELETERNSILRSQGQPIPKD